MKSLSGHNQVILNEPTHIDLRNDLVDIVTAANRSELAYRFKMRDLRGKGHNSVIHSITDNICIKKLTDNLSDIRVDDIPIFLEKIPI